MKFLISDNLPTNNRFGKWYYSHDEEIRSWTDGTKLILWLGYTIETDIQEIIEKDTHRLKEVSGKFCVIILFKDTLQVCLDYFGQTKVYYHTRDGLTVTNNLASLPLTEVDIKSSSVNYFVSRLGDDVTMYERACKDPMNMRYIYEWNDFSHDNTVFDCVSSVPRDYWLEHKQGQTSLTKIHDTYAQNFSSFGSQVKMSNAELEDKIHKCMDQHSDIIKSNYNNICSSISEGIDSTLQDHYFDANTRLMYHPEDLTSIDELPPKYNLIEQYRQKSKEIKFDVFDVKKIDTITCEHVHDPMLSWVDTVPTIWQINKLPQKPNVLLYGTCADEMFMHVPNFLFARIPPAHRQSYSESYGGRKSPARSFKDPYNGQDVEDWHSKLAEMAKPRDYGRDIETQTGVLTTSLYADRRIFNLLHTASLSQQIDSMANVGTQKRILRDKFNFNFDTKFKDGAGFECRMVIKQLLTKILHKVTQAG